MYLLIFFSIEIFQDKTDRTAFRYIEMLFEIKNRTT